MSGRTSPPQAERYGRRIERRRPIVKQAKADYAKLQ